jgi:tetratricopeptide (TPR) repeat protein
MNHAWIIDRQAAFGADRSAAKRGIERRIRRRSHAAAVPGGASWLDHARRALATSEFHTAAYAARRARQQYGETAEVWSVLARAHAGMDRLEDAVVEARRAVDMAPSDPEAHLTLASIYADLGNWQEALRYYLDAVGMDPGNVAAHVGTASVFLRNGDPHTARRILEDVYERSSDPRAAGDYLALALTEIAEQVPAVRDTDSYFVTSDAEIAEMRTLLVRAAEVVVDPDLQAGVARIRRYVDDCARREFVPSRLFRRLPGRLGLLLAGVLMATAVVAAVLFGQIAPVFAAAVPVLGAVGYGLLRYARVPRWRLNHLAHQREEVLTSPDVTGPG